MDLQQPREPGCICMAILAFLSKETGMNGRLGMASTTLVRSAAKDPFLVAQLALNFSMPAGQGKEVGMLKVAKPVYPIMAVQAIRAKKILVAGHECFVMTVVACFACLQVACLDTICVAAVAGNEISGKIQLVTDQAEGCIYAMVERFSIQGSWQPGHCLMAILASRAE